MNLLLPLPAKALKITVKTNDTNIKIIPKKFTTLWVFIGANILEH